MEAVQGTVSDVSSKEWQDKLLWSFQVDGDKRYFRTGEKKPNFSVGDLVKFEFEQKGKSNAVQFNTIKSKKGDGSYTPKPKPSYNGGGFKKKSNSRDDYWENKDKYDKQVTQPMIHLQSATNAAINLVAAAVQAECSPLPKSGKKEEKFEAYKAIVLKVADELFANYCEKVESLNAGNPPVEQKAVEVQEVINEEAEIVVEQAETSSDDGWGEDEDWG